MEKYDFGKNFLVTLEMLDHYRPPKITRAHERNSYENIASIQNMLFCGFLSFRKHITRRIIAMPVITLTFV